jgi:hypothetical protein
MRSWLVKSGWFGRLVALAVGCFVVGWALVLTSGHGGNHTGGSEAVWRIGGVMVYVALPLAFFGLVAGVAGRLRAGAASAQRS